MLLLTEKGERRKTLNVNNGFPTRVQESEKERCLGLELSRGADAVLCTTFAHCLPMDLVIRSGKS